MDNLAFTLAPTMIGSVLLEQETGSQIFHRSSADAGTLQVASPTLLSRARARPKRLQALAFNMGMFLQLTTHM